MSLLYKRLYSIRNLTLAWSRLKTAQNLFYKGYYRDLFVAYEFEEKANLLNLSQRLKSLSYEPYKIFRMYLPKATGLHRPISFLCLDDLIVYQAICNVFAERISKKREKIELENVFSNILNRQKNKNIFLLKKWQEGYSAFIRKIKQYYDNDVRWVAHFDLAAFYDTIDHDSLCKQIVRNIDDDICRLIAKCLKKWSSEKLSTLKHGIPQGPNSSDFMAEVYLFPIDKVLHAKGIKYVRYVDDIKIFGSTKEEVLDGVILLEKECKERGLIPQSKKYEVIHAQSYADAIGKNPSIPFHQKSLIPIDSRLQSQLFDEASDAKNFDVSKLRYIFGVAGPNSDICRFIISGLNSHPELINGYCHYLENYCESQEIAGIIIERAILLPSAYEYVEGKYWELLSKFSLPSDRIFELRKRVLKRLRQAQNKPTLRIGLYAFIARIDNGLLLRWLPFESFSFIQMLFAKHINPSFYDSPDYKKMIDRFLLRSIYDPTLVAMKEMIYNSRPEFLDYIQNPRRDRSNVLNNTRGNYQSIDTIGQILNSRYSIPYSKIWCSLLGGKYKHSNHLLHLADNAFYMDRSAWVNYSDSFNDVVVEQLINYLKEKMPHKKWPDTIYNQGDRQGQRIDLGNLLDPSNLLSIEFPGIINGIRLLHKRRRTTPSSHAYETKTGEKTKYVTGKEQLDLCESLKNSYIELINVVIALAT